MDSYVIRIYRREKGDPRVLVGVVEPVGIKPKQAFNTIDDLWEILNSGEGRTGKKAENQKGSMERGPGGRPG